MILFPAIDLKDGQCVRLKLGDMEQATVFNDDPAAQAKSFEDQGFEYLHVVDLNGAFAGESVNGAAVDAILEAVKNLNSVAVEVYEDSVNYSVHGSYRLVSYARFLVEHYFALTARLCAEEGLLMNAYTLGDKTAGERLTALKNRTDDFYTAYSGR